MARSTPNVPQCAVDAPLGGRRTKPGRVACISSLGYPRSHDSPSAVRKPRSEP